MRSGGSPIELLAYSGASFRVVEPISLNIVRRRSNRMLAGVAGGLADSLGVSDGYVRAAFVTLASVWGLGAILYVALWLMTFDRVSELEADPVETQRAVGLAVAFVGLMSLLGVLGLWPNPAIVLTVAALAFGTAALTDGSRAGPLVSLLDPDVERPTRTRVVIGALLLLAGLTFLGSSVGRLFQVGTVLLAIAVTGLGILIAFGPWVRRLLSDLGEERKQRIRQEERAAVAAHLHDSVLQTLALIQRSDDPGRMALLARHQETELRDWLYGAAPLDGVDMVSTALRQAAARVEADHGVRVEVVTVGDHVLDGRGRALVGAASEALVNAAKHSGADWVSLFFEAEDGQLQVYVTDQGNGFDATAVPPDRKGIDQSIRSRMESVGGSVEIASEPGEGTEVMLRMSVPSS